MSYKYQPRYPSSYNFSKYNPICTEAPYQSGKKICQTLLSIISVSHCKLTLTHLKNSHVIRIDNNIGCSLIFFTTWPSNKSAIPLHSFVLREPVLSTNLPRALNKLLGLAVKERLFHSSSSFYIAYTNYNSATAGNEYIFAALAFHQRFFFCLTVTEIFFAISCKNVRILIPSSSQFPFPDPSLQLPKQTWNINTLPLLILPAPINPNHYNNCNRITILPGSSAVHTIHQRYPNLLSVLIIITFPSSLKGLFCLLLRLVKSA